MENALAVVSLIVVPGIDPFRQGHGKHVVDLPGGEASPGGDGCAFAAHGFEGDAPVEMEGIEGQAGVDEVAGEDQTADGPGEEEDDGKYQEFEGGGGTPSYLPYFSVRLKNRGDRG